MIRYIVGLGNASEKYLHTRHNVVYWLLDRFSFQFNNQINDDKIYHQNDVSIYKMRQYKNVILVYPLFNINYSGSAVLSLMEHFGAEPDEILIVHDDMNLPVGKIKFKKSVGDGGHNGIRDVFAKTGTKDFYRIKIGIGKTDKDWLKNNSWLGYVLGQPDNDEMSKINYSIDICIQEINDNILFGDEHNIQMAMNRLNSYNSDFEFTK